MVFVGTRLTDGRGKKKTESTFQNGQTFSLFPFRSEETSSVTVNSESGTLTGAGNKFHEVDDVNKDISRFIRQPFYGAPALGTKTPHLLHTWTEL